MKNKKQEEKKINNKGFTGYELLTMALVCLVLAFIVLQIALGTRDGEKYSVFIYNAKVLGTNAAQLQLLEEEKEIYLKELIEKGYVEEMKNPFDGDRYCDMNESKVIFSQEERKVTLRCGDYLIKEQPLGADKVKIYKVSGWKEGQGGEKDVTQTFYNYKENNAYIFPDFLEEKLFLKSINQKYQTKFTMALEMKTNPSFEEKVYHRTETLVKEMDY